MAAATAVAVSVGVSDQVPEVVIGPFASTLRAYLDHRQNRSETAAALHLHPNTVTQRLQRIEALSSLNLAEPSAVVQITAALTLLDVAKGDPS